MSRQRRLDSARLRVEALEGRALPSVTIVNQPWDHASSGSVAQVFTNLQDTKYSSYEYDDFTTTQDYTVSTLLVPGVETGGGASFNKAVIGQIWTGLPDQGGTMVMAGFGKEVGHGSLLISFGNQTLTAGSYWITAYVVRPFNNGGGQWYWDRTLENGTFTGSEEYFYNPGGGFGFGTASIPGSTIFGSSEDQAFTLIGNTTTAALVSAGNLSGHSQSFVPAGLTQHTGNTTDFRTLDAAFVSIGNHSTGTSDQAILHHSSGDGQADVLGTGLHGLSSELG